MSMRGILLPVPEALKVAAVKLFYGSNEEVVENALNSDRAKEDWKQCDNQGCGGWYNVTGAVSWCAMQVNSSTQVGGHVMLDILYIFLPFGNEAVWWCMLQKEGPSVHICPINKHIQTCNICYICIVPRCRRAARAVTYTQVTRVCMPSAAFKVKC